MPQNDRERRCRAEEREDAENARAAEPGAHDELNDQKREDRGAAGEQDRQKQLSVMRRNALLLFFRPPNGGARRAVPERMRDQAPVPDISDQRGQIFQQHERGNGEQQRGERLYQLQFPG